MNEKSEKLLKEIYSIDTKAGHRFRYHVMRAEACPKYAKDIDFKESEYLSNSFCWAFTREGHNYWREIFDICLLSGLGIL